MNLSLEFTLTSADLRQLNTWRGWRRLTLSRYLAAIFTLFLGWQTVGLDWLFGLYVAFAVYLFFSHFIAESLLVPLLRFTTKQELKSCVSIDEQTISIEQSKSRREFPWSSLALNGTAREIDNHFWLECRHSGVWIPKRAFSTADDIAAFRALAKEKMGERCQFNESFDVIESPGRHD